MTTRVLAAGDLFVRNRLFIDALRAAAPGDLEFTELTLPWPVEPFGRVAEVDEASGTEERLIEALRGARICVTQMAPLTRRVLEACPDLELFGISRGGPVNANLEAATEHGVAVCYAPGRNAGATAEHTLALILAAVRRIPQTHADLAILGGVGITETGIWNFNALIVAAQRRMIAAAERTIFVLDNSKFGRKALSLTTGFDARFTIVTDTRPSPDVARAITAAGAKLRLTAPDAAEMPSSS